MAIGTCEFFRMKVNAMPFGFHSFGAQRFHRHVVRDMAIHG